MKSIHGAVISLWVLTQIFVLVQFFSPVGTEVRASGMPRKCPVRYIESYFILFFYSFEKGSRLARLASNLWWDYRPVPLNSGSFTALFRLPYKHTWNKANWINYFRGPNRLKTMTLEHRTQSWGPPVESLSFQRDFSPNFIFWNIYVCV